MTLPIGDIANIALTASAIGACIGMCIGFAISELAGLIVRRGDKYSNT